MTLNTNLRNALADLIKSSFDGGTLEIRTAGGTTLLGTITLPGTAFSAASGGAIAKTGTWSTTAVASGVARVARFIGTSSRQMDVAIDESAADMIIDNEDIVAGGTITVVSYTVTMPAS